MVKVALEKLVRFEGDRKKRLVARVFRRCRLEGVQIFAARGERGLDVTLKHVQAGKFVLLDSFAYGSCPALELSQFVQIEAVSNQPGDAWIVVHATPAPDAPGEEASEEPVLQWCDS